MTIQQLNQQGFIVIGRKIESLTFKEYLNQYGIDYCTSPRGVEDRNFIREKTDIVYRHIDSFHSDGGKLVLITESDYNDLEDEEKSQYEYYGEYVTEYQIWNWGPNGNNPRKTGCVFDNEEDACNCIYDLRWSYAIKNCDIAFMTYIEAAETLASELDRNVDVIKRYLSIAAITDRRKAETERAEEERKAQIAIEATREANSLVIDEAFKSAVAWADEAGGKEKSKHMASAMKGLLERNGVDYIKSDFWQVLRILKMKLKQIE